MKHENHVKSQLPHLKIFKLTQKYFAAAGIVPQLATQAYPLNGRTVLGFLIIGSTFVCHFVYIFVEAEKFSEYAQSIYLCSLVALINVVLLVIICNVENLFLTIIDHEAIVNTSEWKRQTEFHLNFCKISLKCVDF